jgi:hypothetical protein
VAWKCQCWRICTLFLSQEKQWSTVLQAGREVRLGTAKYWSDPSTSHPYSSRTDSQPAKPSHPLNASSQRPAELITLLMNKDAYCGTPSQRSLTRWAAPQMMDCKNGLVASSMKFLNQSWSANTSFTYLWREAALITRLIKLETCLKFSMKTWW